MTTRVAQPGWPSASGDDGSRAAEVAEGIGAVDELIGGTDGRQLPDQRVRDRVGQGVGEAPGVQDLERPALGVRVGARVTTRGTDGEPGQVGVPCDEVAFA